MEEKKRDLERPKGAVWIRGYNLKQKIRHVMGDAFEKRGVKFTPQEFDECWKQIREVSHTLAIKINEYKPKYIAIENKSKTRREQPDYFVHEYQSHTGAAPQYPFSNRAAVGTAKEGEVGRIGKDGGPDDAGQANRKNAVQATDEKGGGTSYGASTAIHGSGNRDKKAGEDDTGEEKELEA